MALTWHKVKAIVASLIKKAIRQEQLPYLVGNVIEVLEPDAEDGEFLNACVPHIMYTHI